MNAIEAKEAFETNIKVSEQMITLAKGYFQRPETPITFDHLSEFHSFAGHQGFPKIDQVVVHDSVDTSSIVLSAAGHWSRVLAAAQAFWELVGEGLFQVWSQIDLEDPTQGFTTVVPGSGGNTGGWNVDTLKFIAPRKAQKSIRSRFVAGDHIVDPDIFALEAGLEHAHTEVREAAADGVRCLRAGLFRPTVNMLGKASEGAWIEVGLTIAAGITNARQRRTIEELLRGSAPVMSKIEKIRSTYENKTIFSDTYAITGVRPPHLISISAWSDVVRDARHAIHFESEPTTANSYRKVVCLFLAGADYLRKLYSIKVALQAVQ